MSIRLFLLERYLPAAVRRRMFRDLVRMTAGAFRAPARELDDVPAEALVGTFAVFTRDLVERVGDGHPEAAAIRQRLHDGAREMGRIARHRARVRSAAEAARAIRLIYRALGVDVEADVARGTLTVTRCAFSAVYTPRVCRFISALDAGLVEGLTGGMTLVFTARITEGAACCRAQLDGSASP